jgi:hypothetical protein
MPRIVIFLNWLSERIMLRRKKAWARFQVGGIQSDGQIKFEIAYNKAFLKNVRDNGLSGATEEETVENFLFGALMFPKNLEEEVTSEAHPDLLKDTNSLKHG